MRQAIISDLHSNIFAADAVLADINKKSIDSIVCLGDIIGYGAHPKECIDFVIRNCQFSLRGNHDDWIINKNFENFGDWAYDAARFTSKIISPGNNPLYTEARRWTFLHLLPITKKIDNIMYVHASPRPNLHLIEYLHADDGRRKLGRGHPILLAFKNLNSLGVKLCFHGHTHYPGILFVEGEEQIFIQQKRLILPYKLQDRTYMVNVGSVGYSRDGNPQACYVIFDTEKRKIEFRRISYNFALPEYAIRDTLGIPNELGNRIKHGV